MVVLHATFLVAGPLETLLLSRVFRPLLAASCIVGLCVSMALRYWAIGTLGERWSTRIICRPGEPAIRRGPYRWMRHPNYGAVVLEMVTLPMIHTAWLTATLYSVLNLWMLRVRVRSEEHALRRFADYDRIFASDRSQRKVASS